jgi:hypothetical protein
MRSPSYLADFDSASAMLRANARYLEGKDFPRLGTTAPVAAVQRPLAAAVNALPDRLREQIYIFSGAAEGISPARIGEVRAEEIARWAVGSYPQRRYPAVAIGSSNGALTHLWAALGIPWLPQTVLIPVRAKIPVDDPAADLEMMRAPAHVLLDANPELELHHMHDPAQDRLMIHRMTYFRIKWIRLAEAYETFLRERLLPGATIFVVECQQSWPTTQVGERHYFQFGAVGGPDVDEYFHGSQRVATYLQRYHASRERWEPPTPDAQRPEAEWGYAPALNDDLARLARECGYRVRRVVFEDPHEPSPLVADLYRWWYTQRGLAPNRLIVDSFILMEPFWTLRTGSAPFWMTVNMEPSADALEAYLNAHPPFDEIYLMLFSHGVNSVGLTPIERWKALLGRARRRSDFLGVDTRAYPRDFATFVRYHTSIPDAIAARYPLPGPLALSQLDVFLEISSSRYRVRFEDGLPDQTYAQETGRPRHTRQG